MSTEKCQVCTKTVYPMERMAADNVVFHKGCMKCEHCQKSLTLGNFAALSGKYYCKPHFKQLFALKGNYSEGFGDEKHTAKWSPDTSAYVRGNDFTKPSSGPSSGTSSGQASPAVAHKAEKKVEKKVEASEPSSSAEAVEPKVEKKAEKKVEADEPVQEEKKADVVSGQTPEPTVEDDCAGAPSLSERMGAFKVSDSPVDSPKATRSADSPSLSVKKEACQVCGKTVYPMERMAADNVVFHKGCMKCAECDKSLTLGNYASLSGKYYCKPHFKQLFALKGNYSEGFGEEKHTAKWKKDTGDSLVPCAAASQVADDLAE